MSTPSKPPERVVIVKKEEPAQPVVSEKSKAEMTKDVKEMSKTTAPVSATPYGAVVGSAVDAPATPKHYKVPPVHGTPIPGTTVPAAAVVEEDESEHTDTVGTSKTGKISTPSDVEPDTEEQLHQDHKKEPVKHEKTSGTTHHTNHPHKK